MSTAALGSAGAGEPPHLADRTTNTPTTWRLYSPLCCSRAAAALPCPPSQLPPLAPAGCSVKPAPRCKTYAPLLATAAAPVAPRAPRGHFCGRMWQWALEPFWGQEPCFPLRAPRLCVRVCVCLPLLVFIFFSS